MTVDVLAERVEGGELKIIAGEFTSRVYAWLAIAGVLFGRRHADRVTVTLRRSSVPREQEE